MARTAPKNSDSNEPVEAPAVEAPAENAETPTAEAPAVEFDLTAFKGLLDAAISAASPADGTLEDSTTQALVEAYRVIPGAKAKRDARQLANEEMRAQMLTNTPEGMQKARAAMYLQNQLDQAKAAPKAAVSREPVDPTEGFVDRVVGVRLAYNVLIGAVPTGVAPDWEAKVDAKLVSLGTQVSEYAAYLATVASLTEGAESPTEPEVDDIVRTAFKLGKAPKVRKVKTSTGGTRVVSYTGPRRSVTKHIEEAFAGEPVGTFLKVSAISAFRSTEYGDDSPSPGAVTAALKSWTTSGKRPIAGVESANQGGLGAVKTA